MKCSVLILAYNQEKYIAQCLDGVLMQQTDFDYDVVIGEDSSTDSTRSICKEYTNRYSNFRLLNSPDKKNLGYYQNWDRTLSECKGDYIAICEGDDYWTDSHKLQKQVDFLDKNPECGLCFTDCDIYYEDSNTWEHSIFENGISIMNFENPLFGKGYKGNLTWMFRRELLSYVEIIKECTDVPLILLYEAFLHFKLGFIPDNTGVFRIHNGSYSNSPSDQLKKYNYFRNRYMIYFKYAPLMPNPEQTTAHYYQDALSLYREACEYQDSGYIQKIHEYFSNHIDELMGLYVAQQKHLDAANNEIVRLRNTKKYKLGDALLSPLAWAKRL